MQFRIMASRHSAFYSPLLTSIQLLREDGHQVSYSVLAPGQRTYELLRDGAADIVQSAVSSNWGPRERGVSPLPVHFAQINRRDGFFLVGRAERSFAWRDLEGSALLADHGHQPLVMLRYALQYNGVDWNRIQAIDAGTPAAMQSAFASGSGDYVHLQASVGGGKVLASVGAAMPPLAFSSLCCARPYRQTEEYRVFLAAFERARQWTRSSPPAEVAAREANFFPDIPAPQMAEAVALYQGVGNWEGGIEITREEYEQALNVFEAAGAIACRHPYDEVVACP